MNLHISTSTSGKTGESKQMTPENTLSIYGSHDAGAVYIDSNGNIKVLEYERFVKKRYAMFSSDQDHREGLGSNDQERRDSRHG